jgi:hypothetical protein
MIVLSPSNLAVFRSLSACLASSRPVQLWLSSIRCLPQKRFWQNPQSPTIGCAKVLHPCFEHRGLLDFLGVRVVLAPATDVVVAVPEEAVDIFSDLLSESDCVDVGGSSLSVDDSLRSNSLTVREGSNCLSSSRILALAGRVVEADRNSRTFDTVCDGLTLSLIAEGFGISNCV